MSFAMQFDSGRVFLDPQPMIEAQVAVEVVMLGHCPGRADLNFLFADRTLLQDIENLGYADYLDGLRHGSALFDSLYGLPIAIRSLSQFTRLFPNKAPPVLYQSRLAGQALWLPACVEDFFQQADTTVRKKLWLINVDQRRGQRGFFPSVEDNPLQAQLGSAFCRALAIPGAGILTMPDLERLQVPAQINIPPRLRLAKPTPSFLPCADDVGDDVNDDVQERNAASTNAASTTEGAEAVNFGEMLAPMLQALALRRPDIHLLLSLPYDRELTGEQPQVALHALRAIRALKAGYLHQHLHRVQFLYPHLQNHRYSLMSSVGLIAGRMAEITATSGAWRSVAGSPLPGYYQPLPLLSQTALSALRDDFGIGLLRLRLNQTELDDERLASGVFGDTADHARSGEIARFIGWLRRELEKLGWQMLFSVDVLDPRPQILLQDFFSRLYQLGALRGKTPEQAFSLRRITDSDGATVIFDIAFAPAFPIDTIRVQLKQDTLEISRG